MLAIRRSATRALGRAPVSIVATSHIPHAVTCRVHRIQTVRHNSSGPDATSKRAAISYDVNLQNEEQAVSSQTDVTATHILEASLKHVPQHGWTVQALGAGASDLGYPSVLHGLFPRGGVDLIDYFLKKSKREMKAEMEKLDLESMKITAKIRTACITRLKLTGPYISRWPEALALMGQPQNVPMSLGNLGELVDDMWYLAGDRSVDMNWYSKRTLLAGVYTSTELYMTQDRSPDFEETWKFLDRRLQDVAFIGRTASEVTNYLQFGVRSAFGILSSFGHKTPFNR
ncbi:rpsU-divergently transcribed protein [Spizellomyces punctatus DAOM BR117]|uniref:Ubiquinone biosynthesis protein n=1 Tax=Spizellomyces punctatus (strain DAOM BR117) TaxID=645134 RepID=A0A0L0HQ26_SPIPD|nr:rpsU-divergently transcribed protein [Spizellomyces punctatus DAOM BR117]KND03526.1 rpsU-divergently transcribed protein [Spizellomyces punctatus DAOM BR117]|eukprot:XP_016611565.1 rpsU-divergently transcribed protein [Spizellomyces punctatus DAOM BR117]